LSSLRLVGSLLALSVALSCIAPNVGASPIVATGIFPSHGGEITISSTGYVDVAIGVTPWGTDGTFATPDPVFVSADDLGQTFSTITRADPGFDAFVDLLTNGDNDMVWLLFGVQPQIWTATGGPESLMFFGDPDGTAHIDLQGYEIDQIDFVLDRFILTSPGEDPNGDGNWTDHDVQISMVVSGVPIPEPAPHLLCLQGLVLLATARRLTGRRS